MPDSLTGRVDAVRIVDRHHALVVYSILSFDNQAMPRMQGGAVKVHGTWRVSRTTYCGYASMLKVSCPAR